jgi:hypothetical protein
MHLLIGHGDDSRRCLAIVLGELAEVQQETERRFQESDRRLQETERFLREQSQETRRFLREQSQETDRKIQATVEENRQINRQLSQQIGKLGGKWGLFVENADRYAYRQRLFVLAQSGETVVILNDAQFQPRAW